MTDEQIRLFAIDSTAKLYEGQKEPPKAFWRTVEQIKHYIETGEKPGGDK